MAPVLHDQHSELKKRKANHGKGKEAGNLVSEGRF